jgi:hypothetical protein
MKSLSALLPLILITGLAVHAKTFKNSYVTFDLPDDWTCAQEGVAWTCNPRSPVQSREAVIVLAAKVAGPEDNIGNFMTILKQPKKIMTKVGMPMPSQVMYAQQRNLGGQAWVQAQHLSSEIQDFYTLYLATVKDRLAILISFSSEKTRYQVYNPMFDRVIRSLKITANQQLLFPKTNVGSTPADMVGIQGPGSQGPVEDMMPPPEKRAHPSHMFTYALIGLLLAAAGAAYIFKTRRKKITHSKTKRSRPK